MKLIIVESPTKAKTLSRFLGNEYSVTASMGHVRDLPSNKMNIDVKDDFKPSYGVVEDKLEVVDKISKMAKKAETIYLAMDPDREGEAIAYHMRYVLKDKLDKKMDFKRISFHQITKEAVKEAIKHAGRVNLKLVDAQQARRILDRLVGYSLSPVLWKKVRRGLSAGRVQSVALRLVVEREREIEAFKEKEYWEVAVEVAKKKEAGMFWVDLMAIDGKKLVEGKNDERVFLLASKDKAMPVVADLKRANYSVERVEKRERKRRPKPPYTTSTLQQAAATRLSWTAKRTMRVAQSLYENGLITYHRTDSTHLAGEAVAAARKLIGEEYGADFVPSEPRFYKTKSKSAQEAHEAIRPTRARVKPAEVDGDTDAAGKKLYGMVWRRFVACQMVDAVEDATTIDVTARGKRKYGLRATGSVIKFDGWRKVYGRRNVDEEAVLPEVEEKEELKYKDLKHEQKFTQPPPRFNDASLVKTLEQLGIGRPSTYAPTIGTLIGRGYMERKDRQFVPSPVGTTVTDFLSGNFKEIMDYGFTAEMEDDLDKIAEGKREWVPMMREFWRPFHKLVDEVTEKAKRVQVPAEETGRACPECGRKEKGREVIRIGRFGKFLSCSRFPDCKYTDKYQEKVGRLKCEKCKEGDVVVKRTRKGRTFFGCSRYPECDWASWTDPRKPGKEGKGNAKKKVSKKK